MLHPCGKSGINNSTSNQPTAATEASSSSTLISAQRRTVVSVCCIGFPKHDPGHYPQGNRPAMNRRKAALATSSLRDISARTQLANSFIVSLRFGVGLGMQIFAPLEF
jgi:hypothetical protein